MLVKGKNKLFYEQNEFNVKSFYWRNQTNELE